MRTTSPRCSTSKASPVRSGHHCAHPLMQFFGVPATCRASLAFYNTHDEIDAFVAALGKVRKLLG